MCGRKAVSLLAILLLAPGPELLAQDIQARDTAYDANRVIPPGTRVRVDAPALFANRLDGTIEALRPDTLLLSLAHDGAEPTPVPVASIERLEIFTSNRAPYGEVFGALVGMLAGGALMYGLAPEGRSGADQLAQSFYVSIGVILGGGAGYLVGKQVDKALFGEEWEEVPVSRVLWETRLPPQVGAFAGGTFVLSVSISL